jgi:hypothetical protein
MEDQLLMALEYLRECRIYFYIAQSYGISENSAYKGIKWIEKHFKQASSLCSAW